MWFYARGSATEGARFCGLEVVRRQTTHDYSCTQIEQFNCMVIHDRSNGISACAVATQDYEPVRVVFDMLQLALKEFKGSKWFNNNKDKFATLKVDTINNEVGAKFAEILAKYQTPEKVDKILMIQKELDDTKKVAFSTIDQLLERDERLRELVQKSDDLSFATKAMAERSKELNRCGCTIL
jgi:synaptobrevin family protein YKT6